MRLLKIVRHIKAKTDQKTDPIQRIEIILKYTILMTNINNKDITILNWNAGAMTKMNITS